MQQQHASYSVDTRVLHNAKRDSLQQMQPAQQQIFAERTAAAPTNQLAMHALPVLLAVLCKQVL
jgi:hypothetical protein